MHEYSIVESMFEQIAETASARGASRVHRVRIRIGRLAGVDIGLLKTAYETFRSGTICESAPIDIDDVPAVWGCPAGHGPIPLGGPLRCDSCGRPARLESGDEIILDQLELEVP